MSLSDYFLSAKNVAKASYNFVAKINKVEVDCKNITKGQRAVYLDAIEEAIAAGDIDPKSQNMNKSKIILKGLTPFEKNRIEKILEEATLKVRNQNGKNSHGTLRRAWNFAFADKHSTEIKIAVTNKQAVQFVNKLQEALENGNIKSKYSIKVDRDGNVKFNMTGRGGSMHKEMEEIVKETGYDASAVGRESEPEGLISRILSL